MSEAHIHLSTFQIHYTYHCCLKIITTFKQR